MTARISQPAQKYEQPPPNCGQRLLPTIIDEIARSDPERVFAAIPRTADPQDGFDDISFYRFAKAIDGFSWWLEAKLGKGSPHETIAYVGSLDLMYHIVTLATVKIGHTAFLPSHRNSLEAHTHLLDEIGCNISLLQASIPPGLSHILDGKAMRTISIPNLEFFLQPDEVPSYSYHKTFTEARHSPFVILHTSGSTGLPQLITVNHGTLASMDANQLIPPLTGRPIVGSSLPETRLLMAFPLFHMASFTLLLGLAVYYRVVVVLPPANEPMTARLIDSIHINARVDGSVLPPSILVDIYHERSFLPSLSRLKYLFFAGGSLPREVGDQISKITYLATLFGSTETAFPPQEVCDSEDWEYVRYSPFNGSVFHPLHEDGLFEHIIVRRRELDLFQSVFSTFPDIDEFRTKDLYRAHPIKPDLWKFCGRTDDVIVFSNAEKFNPVDFESAISSHPAIKTALVGGHGKFQTCLLVEPMAMDWTGDGKTSLLNDIWPTISEANHACPTHARVMKDFVIFTDKSRGVERTGKGTVQRMMTLQLYQEEIDKLYQSPVLPNTSPEMLIDTVNHKSENLRDALARIVSSCTWLNGELTCAADLFELGLDSLQTISLSKQINAYFMQAMPNLKPVKPQTIYAHPTIEKLESALQSVVDSSMRESRHQKMQTVFNEWSSYLPEAKEPVALSPKNNIVLLLTGSTGSLGSYILDALLSFPNLERIYCLNRGQDGESRQTKSFKFKGLKAQFQRVIFLQCDLSEKFLGLREDTYHNLLHEITHVIHNAWDVNFNHPLEAFVIPHISGVRYLVDFCTVSACNAHLLFVSTESTVLGKREMRDEAIPEEIISSWANSQPMGYAQSKLIAERIIDTAARTSSLRSIICRVGQISGPTSEQGCWSLSEWFPSLIASSVHIGMLPNSLASMDAVNWIPVNLVARIIVELLFSSEQYPASSRNSQSSPGYPGSKFHSTTADQPSELGQFSVSDDIEDRPGHSQPSQQVMDEDTVSDNLAKHKVTETTLNTIQASDRTARMGIIQTVAIDNNLDRTTAIGSSKIYNVVNPFTTTWQQLIASFQDCCLNPLQVTSFPEWLEALQARAESENDIAKLPAIRIIDFFERFLQPSSRSGHALNTSEALKDSETMARLAPVSDQWVKIWMHQWGFSK